MKLFRQNYRNEIVQPLLVALFLSRSAQGSSLSGGIR